MFKCKDLFELESMQKARIIAGKAGLNRTIRWVFKAEDMSFDRWTKGGELLFLGTAVLTVKDFSLFSIVEKAHCKNLSGVTLLVGENFINRIPKKVITYCNEHELPLILQPWNIPLIEVFEEIGHAIIKAEKIYVDSSVLSLDMQKLLEKWKLDHDFQQFCNVKLEGLLKQDSENATCYMQTLKMYLLHSCNIVETAKHMDVHRNTVRYRIQRIEEILGVSLQDVLVRYEMLTVLLLYKMV